MHTQAHDLQSIKELKKELVALESGVGAFGLKLNLKGRRKQYHQDRIEAVKSYIAYFENKVKEVR